MGFSLRAVAAGLVGATDVVALVHEDGPLLVERLVVVGPRVGMMAQVGFSSLGRPFIAAVTPVLNPPPESAAVRDDIVYAMAPKRSGSDGRIYAYVYSVFSFPYATIDDADAVSPIAASMGFDAVFHARTSPPSLVARHPQTLAKLGELSLANSICKILLDRSELSYPQADRRIYLILNGVNGLHELGWDGTRFSLKNIHPVPRGGCVSDAYIDQGRLYAITPEHFVVVDLLDDDRVLFETHDVHQQFSSIDQSSPVSASGYGHLDPLNSPLPAIQAQADPQRTNRYVAGRDRRPRDLWDRTTLYPLFGALLGTKTAPLSAGMLFRARAIMRQLRWRIIVMDPSAGTLTVSNVVQFLFRGATAGNLQALSPGDPITALGGLTSLDDAGGDRIGWHGNPGWTKPTAADPNRFLYLNGLTYGLCATRGAVRSAGAFTFVAWFRAAAPLLSPAGLIGFEDDAGEYRLAVSSLNVHVGATLLPSLIALDNGNWHMVAVVVDPMRPAGQQLLLYIDALPVAMFPFAPAAPFPWARLLVGASTLTGGDETLPTERFTGWLGDIYVFADAQAERYIDGLFDRGPAGVDPGSISPPFVP